jgi:hypothetical protein
MTILINFSELSYWGLFAAVVASSFASELFFGSEFSRVNFIGQIIHMIALAILMHNLQIKTIDQALQLAILVWIGFTATVLFNEPHWRDEKAQAFLLHHASYLLRAVVMASMYFYIAF